jgi:HipA-like protein
MRKAKVLVNSVPAGTLEELERGTAYRFFYLEEYKGESVSLTMPLS